MNRTLLIAAALFVAQPSWACDRWLVKGQLELKQSNNLVVKGGIAPADPNVIGNLRGKASFFSPTLDNHISGPIEAVVTGNHVVMRIYWAGSGSEDQNKCHDLVETALDILSIDKSMCRPEQYIESATYEGWIDSNGNAVGQTWPDGRPSARTTWTAANFGRCVEGIPATPDELRKAEEAQQELPNRTSPGALQVTDPIAREVTPADKAREVGSMGKQFSEGDMTRLESSSVKAAPIEIIGSYDTDFGQLLLGAGGGRYEYNGGRLAIRTINDNVVEGTWSEEGASNVCPGGKRSGPFRFVFDEAGFKGHYGNCGEEPTRPWNGTRR